jgi:[lysine-biosynthesis-protein LysW]---L-2-aminoadipate ligase
VRVALVITDGDFYEPTGYADAWVRALRDEGAQVDRLARIPDDWGADGPPRDRWDLAIAHVLTEEVAVFGDTLKVAAVLEQAGVPLVNSVASIVASSDKLATHAIWAAHGVPQPRGWDLDRARAWPVAPGTPLVVKPTLGDGARDISLVRSLEEAAAARRSWREPDGPGVLEEWIEEPVCVRIYATPDRTSMAYEKSREAGSLVTHGTVYPRVSDPPAEMAALARRMVATLGGGLMGVDVLTDGDGRHWALEANAPFGFDVTDPEQCRFVAEAALERAGALAG